ncbi:MAG: hypothetical protein L0H31_06205 [Nocardioidaceae bacterium]|nr:hypothetical protein [Nocardioidaceae bacterium]
MFDSGIASFTTSVQGLANKPTPVLPPPLVAGAAGGSAGASGLALAEAEISVLLKDLRDQRKNLKDSTFDVDGYVPGRSYGNGAEAVALANGHARAHQVTVQTLTGLINDLQDLQVAIKEAKALVGEADAQAKDDLTAILTRTEGIDLGEQGHARAQVDHRDDTNPDLGPKGV